MKRFEVEVKHFIYIDADTLQDANVIMQEKHSDFETVDFYDLEKRESHPVIGHCEMTGLSIFKGDDFTSDSEGVMILNSEETI